MVVLESTHMLQSTAMAAVMPCWSSLSVPHCSAWLEKGQK